jgi:hypothetical protein
MRRMEGMMGWEINNSEPTFSDSSAIATSPPQPSLEKNKHDLVRLVPHGIT